MSVTDITDWISQIRGSQSLQPFADYVVEFHYEYRLLIYSVLALFIGYLLGRKSRHHRLGHQYQNGGESAVARLVLENFASPNYHLMNHITLRVGDGTTQIDHILVSRTGVFVIETKNYTGWIYANEKQASWTQVIFYWRNKFQNPLRQNYKHLCAVREILEFLEPENIKSLVVFTGDAKFRTDIPPGVIRIAELTGYLRANTNEIMSQNRLQFCVGRIETARLAISGKTDVEHAQYIESKYPDDD